MRIHFFFFNFNLIFLYFFQNVKKRINNLRKMSEMYWENLWKRSIIFENKKFILEQIDEDLRATGA